jgi:hypothetical protein
MKSVFLVPVAAGLDASCQHYGAIPCLLLQLIGNLKGPTVWIRIGLATSTWSLSANLFRHSDRVICNFTPLGAGAAGAGAGTRERLPSGGLSNARPTFCFCPAFCEGAPPIKH